MGSLKQAFDNLKGKSVVVTGDTGFKGSWLSLWLHLAGAKVSGFALPAENSQTHFSQLGLEKIIRHKDGDVRDASALKKFIKESELKLFFIWQPKLSFEGLMQTRKLLTTQTSVVLST